VSVTGSPVNYQEGIVMNSQQGAPGGSWALRSLVIAIGEVACSLRPAAAGGDGARTGRVERRPANDKACADIAADRVFSSTIGRVAWMPTILDALAAQIQSSRNAASWSSTATNAARAVHLALGEKRASVVVNYLAALGVDPARMQAASYGKERPAVIGDGEEIWAQNRRAVMVFK
jgi:hypothetical protein